MGLFLDKISNIVTEDLTDVQYRREALNSGPGKKLKEMGLKRNEIISTAFPAGATGFESAPPKQQYLQRLSDKVKELESQSAAPDPAPEPAPDPAPAPDPTPAPAPTDEQPTDVPQGTDPWEALAALKTSNKPRHDMIDSLNKFFMQ